MEKLVGVTAPNRATGTPRTMQMLKMFEPRMLPRTSSVSPFLAATIVVTSSGRDVPRAMTLRAITRSEMPILLAILVAESTTKLEPTIIPTRPRAVNSRDRPSFHLGFSGLADFLSRECRAREMR